ncbi:glycosyltransferase family 2 protein [Salipiger sp. IMCC34102]|uniref:glycosyltransferase family 2 protein n=1 Tax=Salipiger sp. IMCC34102 TaxID=2510647 RepID=UPI0013EA5842|nr:glycosyltransferase family 2 protein [Salipiger sp. IMCC34102]
MSVFYMPYQHLTMGSTNRPFRPGQIEASAKFEVPAWPASKRAPWLPVRFGFIGSRAGFDLLRFEAPTFALTPRNARQMIEGGLIDALVIEAAPDDLMQEWGLSFLDWTSAGVEARDLMHRAADAGMPRIAVLRGGGGEATLFAPLATEADHAFVMEDAAQNALRVMGIKAELIAPAMQPALFNGFAAELRTASAPSRFLSLDLARAIEDPSVASVLDGIMPFGPTLCSADLVVRKERVGTLTATLLGASIGTVTSEQLRHLFATSDVLVQVARPDREPGRDIQHALNAVASRCAVAIVGEIDAQDPRRAFAHVFPDPSELRTFLSRFTLDQVSAHSHTRTLWRKVHSSYAADAFALRLARCVDPDIAARPGPRATVVTPTYRPDRLGQVLETFRSQSWGDRELVVVANTDIPAEWNTEHLELVENEQIVFLPRRYGPGAALNLGAARGTGDYVLRMDDDDYYGCHYVEDAMLGARAMGADLVGQHACFYYYLDDDRLVWRPNLFHRPTAYESSNIGNGGHVAGFSHCVRRSLLLEDGYHDHLHGGADVAFLDKLADRGDLVCVRNDGLNAVVGRRSDIRSHTWQTALGADDARYKALSAPLDALLDEDLLMR